MNHSLRFYYILKSDDSYYTMRRTVTHFKEEMATALAGNEYFYCDDYEVFYLA